MLFSYLAVARPSGTDRDVIMYLLGAWNSAFVTMLSYWLGSSQGSRRKDDQLADLVRSANMPSPAQIVGKVVNAVVPKARS